MKKTIIYILGALAAALGALSAYKAWLPMKVGVAISIAGAVTAALNMFLGGTPPTIPPLTPGAGIALFLFIALSAGSSGCKTTGGITVPPVVAGVVDCALPSLWSTITFANLIPIVEHAVEQKDPIGALTNLLKTYDAAEVDCVVAYLNDLGTREVQASASDSVAKTRVSVTAAWLKRSGATTPQNFAGLAK